MARQSKGLLSGGLFAKPILNTRIKTNTVSKKEKYLGHLIGPLGLIFVVNTVAALVEKFFTQQVGAMYGAGNIEAVQAMGGRYEWIMTIAKFLGVGLGLFNSFLISKTKSKQGRFRPWYLIFGFVSIIVCAAIFLFPGTTLGENYWYYFFTMLICYHTVGSSFFYVFRDNIVSVSTRDPKEKQSLTFIRKVSWTLISGILIGMMVSSVLIPFWLEKDINGYAILLIALSLVAIPLFLMEYFYTRERVIEDVATEVGEENENRIPLKSQFKALFTNKYWIILTVLSTLGSIVDNFKGGNVQYFYIKFMLNGENDGMMFMLYQIITGIPTGIGAFAIFPLAKKVGIKNMAIGGYTLVLIGSILGWMFPDQMVPVMIGGFLRQTGWMPNAYILAALPCYALDHVEFKSGLRLEGLLGLGIVGAITALMCAPFAGGYEAAILKLGFVDAEGVTASTTVKSFMTLSFYLFDIILALANIVLLQFVNVEKKMPGISAELLRRKKEAVLARGETWIEPEEQDRLVREKEERLHEENRIADLKALCEKKGLNFEEENAKYLENKKKSDEAWAKKEEAKKEKKEKKLQAVEARRQARYDRLSPEKKRKREERARIKQEKFDADWAKDLEASKLSVQRYMTEVEIRNRYRREILAVEDEIDEIHSAMKALNKKTDAEAITAKHSLITEKKGQIKTLKSACAKELKAIA